MSGLLYGAVAEFARVVEVPIAIVGSPLLSAAQGAAGVAGAAVRALGSLCAEARPKGLESRFLSAVRSYREPQWAELQELLDEEAEEIFRQSGVDTSEKVSVADFELLKPRLLAKSMELREDMKVAFERFDRRPHHSDQEVDCAEVKAVFHLVLQARTDVIASMLLGEFAGVWRRIGDNSSGLIDAQGLVQHARSYASRLPASGINFSEDTVVELADHFAGIYGNLPIEPVEFNALMQELYFELLLLAWTTASSSVPLPAPAAAIPRPLQAMQSGLESSSCSGSANDSKYAFHGACLPVVS
uniref:EF-hand domain-containing protein n=1 Tax=Alexandrium catenella TaxID=2925 RepID=A0A7S1SEZ7_ALECA